uniref:tRNA pseudouridine(38/39) synthase-like n=1 Tax=Sinocyclocheilus anshuiensis TaxID=1608454 RepID=A0A671MTC4_9TELE
MSEEVPLARVKALEEEVERLKAQLEIERDGAGTEERTQTSNRSKQKKRGAERPFDFSAHPGRHVALRLAYLGWQYQGFAVQENTDNTVEARLFEALLKTKLIQDRQTSNYHRCGRTDKGVSAFSQVISIDLRSTQYGEGLGVTVPAGVEVKGKASAEELPYVKMLNSVLPQDIRILQWAPVETGFSARFDCQSRTYRYYFPRGDLDVDLMAEAAKRYEGTHDFRNICKMDVGNGLSVFYSMAVDYPLVLYDCHFEGVNWRNETEEENHVLNSLHQHWVQNAVKTQVLLGMIQGLQKKNPEMTSLQCWLMEGSRQRKYQPFLDRPRCESLESRIQHFVKRGRLEQEEGENGEETTVFRGKRSKHSHLTTTNQIQEQNHGAKTEVSMQ